MFTVLVLLSGLVHGPIPVYRSVGSNSGPLAGGQGTNALTLAATLVTFEHPLPDNVGVGDVIEYDTDGNGTPDALAFIIQRYSATSYEVRNTGVGTPPPAVTHTWSIFRAYLTLAAALNTADRPSLITGGNENPAIDPALSNFDTFDGGMDLPGAGYVWNVACYDDGDVPDDTLVWVGPPWVTDARHRINIFTPVNGDQVGVSQRHHGTWGSGYRRTQALHIVDRDVTVDGLSIQQSRTLGPASDPLYDNRVFLVHTGHKGSDIRISNCYGEQARSDIYAWGRTFDFFDDDQPYGAATTQIRLWNSIGVTFSSMPTTATDGSGAIMANTSDALFIANCTAVAPNGAAALMSGADNPGTASAVIINTIALCDGGPCVAITKSGPSYIADHVASTDDTIATVALTADGGANFPLAAVSLAGPTDFHLAPSDTGAAGLAVDLSGNTLWGFVDDIDGQRRQGAWDLGADQRFTPSPPTVTSGIADPLDATRATLNGTALPNFTATRGWFRYAPGALAGCDDTVGLRAPPTGSIALGQNDTTPLSFAQPVAGLMPGTMYSFCAVATNDAGFGFGAVSVFATPADAGAQPDGGAPDGGALDAGPDGGGADGGASDGGSSAPRRELVGCGCRQDGAAALLPLVLLAGRRLRRRAAAAAATP